MTEGPIITDSEEEALKALVPTRKSTIRPRLRVAIDNYVMLGLSIKDSAVRAGMTPHALQVALKKPHVQKHVSDVKRAWLDNRTSKAWTNIAELADGAQSEDVRLKANRVFLEAAGELGGKGDKGDAGPRQLVQILVQHAQNVGQLPPQQVSGVYEAEPYQPLGLLPSNSDIVGCVESEGDDDDA